RPSVQELSSRSGRPMRSPTRTGCGKRACMRSAGVIGFFFSSMPVGGTMAWASTIAAVELSAAGAAFVGVSKKSVKPITVSSLRMSKFSRSRTPREFVMRLYLRGAFCKHRVRVARMIQRAGSILMAAPPVKSIARQAGRLHPLPVRVMHWTNAVAIFIMIGSGWRIYNDDVIFGWLHFPDTVVIGKWAQYGLQWHFFGMWIFVINGIAYL